MNDETLISFSESDVAIDEYEVAAPEPEEVPVLRDPGLDATGELSRLDLGEDPR